MLAIVQVQPLDALVEVARDQHAVLVDDHDLEGKIGQELAVLRPQRHVEILRVARIGIADVKQGLIGGANGANDLLFKGACEICAGPERGLFGVCAVFRDAVQDAGPDQGDRSNAGERTAEAADMARGVVECDDRARQKSP